MNQLCANGSSLLQSSGGSWVVLHDYDHPHSRASKERFARRDTRRHTESKSASMEPPTDLCLPYIHETWPVASNAELKAVSRLRIVFTEIPSEGVPVMFSGLELYGQAQAHSIAAEDGKGKGWLEPSIKVATEYTVAAEVG